MSILERELLSGVGAGQVNLKTLECGGRPSDRWLFAILTGNRSGVGLVNVDSGRL